MQKLAQQVLKQAKLAGADEAEVLVSQSSNFSAQVRRGNIEAVTEATTRGLQLRLQVGHRVAWASASDLRAAILDGLVKRAVERARHAHEDPCAGLPEEVRPPRSPDGLELYDSTLEELDPKENIAAARECERIGLELDPHIQNSGGAGFSTHRGELLLANSRGFLGSYRASSCSLGLYLLGQEPGREAQVSDYWYTAARHRRRLESPEQVARRTVERVRRHFGARKVPTQKVPVVFEPLLAGELLADFFSAVSGQAIYQRQSFLVDALGQRVAAPSVNIIDDGLLPGGLGTRPFDREGVPSRRTPVVESGNLKNYLCGTYSARKLGLKSTGNGTGNGEVATNFYLAAGPHAPESIVGSVERGLYVTRLMGQGVNLVTGDFSRGAFGLWLENGRVAYPVHEITISGNLRRMFEGIEMVGSDLEFREPIAAPTLKIATMTVAGT